MADTRVSVLARLVEWVRNDPKTILSLVGMAGIGKTSVAITLCRILENDPDVLLGGTFFCSRTTNQEARANVRRILPTLARMLANHSPKFASQLADELKQDSGTTAYKVPNEQIGPLLQRPLAALASETRPIVFIIDALDECTVERDLSDLLRAIADFRCTARVKFILTYRPETHIHSNPVSDRARNEVLQLHTIDPEEVTEDIRTYIDRTFSQHPLEESDTWYSDTDLSALAVLAAGLFIFASTAVKYILDTEALEDRVARLRKTLSAMKNSKVATKPLDEIYELVLTRATDTTKVEPEELARTQMVLACILQARMPLSLTTLGELVQRNAFTLRASLRRLRAVVHVPDDLDMPGLRTLHASFGDYLFDRADPTVRIARFLGDDALSRGCLQVMSKYLRFNVSRTRSSYEENPSTRPDFISHSLEYACLEWVYHVSNLPEPSSLDRSINEVFCPRILFWLEVMSVLDQVWRAAAILMFAAATVCFTSPLQLILSLINWPRYNPLSCHAFSATPTCSLRGPGRPSSEAPLTSTFQLFHSLQRTPSYIKPFQVFAEASSM